jgi:urea transport system ATP-binding protein
MLKVNDLSFSYGRVPALKKVNIQTTPGQMVCITGRNGAGKTTLMQNIIGLAKHSTGTIELDGVDLTRSAPHERVRAGIGYVPQGRMIFPRLTVEENLRIGLAGRADKLRKIPDAIYEYFPSLFKKFQRMGGNLSGGEQQQLAIARALAVNPRLLILDEPTEGIQPNIIEQIGRVLTELMETDNLSVLVVEQYLDFIRRYGHRFYVMNKGEIVADGATEELSDEIVARYLSV